jgi:methionyl-tRNA formyltransferase
MSFLSSEKDPGTVLGVEEAGVVVACGEGTLQLTGLQIPGKKTLPVAEFLRGFQIRPGDVLQS